MLRYRQLILLGLALFVLPVTALAKTKPTPTATPIADIYAHFDQQETASYYVDVPGQDRQFYYYAQNDPIWSSIPYRRRNESRVRYIGAAGCEPTTMAILLRHLLTDEQLWKMNELTYKEKGFLFSPTSSAWFYCRKNMPSYEITNVEQLKRYLPIAMTSFAAGNNPNGTGGFNTIKYIINYFNLKTERGAGGFKAAEAVERGAICMLNVGGKGCPFTSTGHYVAMVGADEEYLYFLDPFLQDYAKTDKKKLLETLSPGFVRAKRENLRPLGITGYLAIFPAE